MYQALFTTTAVTDWLETAVSPRVLHVFDPVCNLVDENGRVISLVTPKIGKGPFSLVVDLANGRFTDFITAESQVSIDGFVLKVESTENTNRGGRGGAGNKKNGENLCVLRASAVKNTFFGRLKVGSLVVAANSAELWNARPLWESVPPSAIKACLPMFENKLASSSPDSLANVNGRFDRLSAGRSDPTSVKAKTAIQMLQNSLKTGDLTACREGARGLAGLGIGLTPAGDDYLLGVMYGLWLTTFQRGDAETQRTVDILADGSVTRTTTLSGAWLKAGARGEAGQAWHELVQAMEYGEETAVTQAIDRILTTGHTSGADALAGFIMALKTHQLTD